MPSAPAVAAAAGRGGALNQLINVAVAEKLPALRTESYFTERPRRASVPKALKVKRAGMGKPPTKGDEIGRPRPSPPGAQSARA